MNRTKDYYITHVSNKDNIPCIEHMDRSLQSVNYVGVRRIFRFTDKVCIPTMQDNGNVYIVY